MADHGLEPPTESQRHGYVAEGWWHPNVKDGRVHEHPANAGRSWSTASHRLCELVYTRRDVARTFECDEEGCSADAVVREDSHLLGPSWWCIDHA